MSKIAKKFPHRPILAISSILVIIASVLFLLAQLTRQAKAVHGGPHYSETWTATAGRYGVVDNSASIFGIYASGATPSGNCISVFATPCFHAVTGWSASGSIAAGTTFSETWTASSAYYINPGPLTDGGVTFSYASGIPAAGTRCYDIDSVASYAHCLVFVTGWTVAGQIGP